MKAMRDRGATPPYVKDSAVIVDFCDLSAKHQLVTAPTIFGLRANFNPKGKELLDQAKEVEAIQEKFPGLDLRAIADMDGIRAALTQVDLLAPPTVPDEIRKASKFAWLSSGEGQYHLGRLDHTLVSVRVNTLGVWEVANHSYGVRTMIGSAPSLKAALQLAEDTLPKEDQQVLRAKASWRGESPTEKQTARVWRLDNRLRERFPNPKLYFEFCNGQFDRGDAGYSRGGLSARIDALQYQRA
jgi:hypothetical protein